VSYFRKACDADIASSWFNLGVMYFEGRGVAPNRRRARVLFERACRGGVPKACENVDSATP
jgi:TPR repeat protein